MTDPVDQIKEAYSRRGERGLDARYSLWDREALFQRQSLERSVLSMLDRHGFRPLDDVEILDVGCGTGSVLRDMVRFGAKPENVAGVDLLEERIERAQTLAPYLDVRVANGAALPFDDNSYDLALAFTMFSSIPNAALRRQVASEMLRVLRPGGAVLWYDFWTNPVNPDVTALGRDEIERLFDRKPVEARRVTLAPPISRRLARYSLLACEIAAAIPLLRTHWLAIVRA